MYKCEICGKELEILKRHLTETHKMSDKEYYDKYLKKENEEVCKMYGQVDSCKKNTKFGSLSKGYARYCSSKCVNLDPDTLAKTKKTNLEKYGVESTNSLDSVKNKKVKSCIEKYGVSNPSKIEEVKEKKKETCKSHYGVEHLLQNKEELEKIKQIMVEKYGEDNPQKIKEFKEKTKKTNLEKYGVEYCVQSEELKEKCQKLKRNKFLIKLNKYLETLNLELVDEKYEKSDYRHHWKCKKCNNIFERSWDGLKAGSLCPNCNPRPLFLNGYSKQEKEVANYVKSLGLEIVENSRKIIPPKEIDIYVPSMKVAI